MDVIAGCHHSPATDTSVLQPVHSSYAVIAAPSTKAFSSSPPSGTPSLTTSPLSNSEVVAALLPSFVCAAMLSFCFLLFGFALMVLVHRQQRHLQEILSLKYGSNVRGHLMRPTTLGAAARRPTTVNSATYRSPAVTSCSSSSSEVIFVQTNNFSNRNPLPNNRSNALSLSREALVGSSSESSSVWQSDAAPSNGVNQNHSSSSSCGSGEPPNTVPHCNTPQSSSSYHSDSFTSSTSSSSAATVTSLLATTRRLSCIPVEHVEILTPRIPEVHFYGLPSAERRGSVIRNSVTTTPQRSPLVAAITATTVNNARLRLLPRNSVNTCATPQAHVVFASTSMEWDNYLPDYAQNNYFGDAVPLSDTEHWV